MKVIYFYLLLSMSVFVKASLQPSKMCTIEEKYKNAGEMKEIEDCSFQLPAAKGRICNVFIGNACNEITSGFLNDVVDYEMHSQSELSVEVLPYSAVIMLNLSTGIVESEPLSAINITFKISNSDVNGVAFFIEDNSGKKNFCRILDFKDYITGITSINLFYDCIYLLYERAIQNVTMTFISLPYYQSLSYYVFLPPPSSQNSVCKWKALIMVFQKALKMGIVHIKFSTAPLHFNVSSYVIELTNAHSMEKTVRTAQLKDQPDSKMIHVQFTSVDEGFYYVAVKVSSLKDSNCLFSNTQIFYVATPFNIGRTLALLLSSFFLLSICLVLVLKFCHTYHNQKLPYKQALIVHSSDCSEHKDFISYFAFYLSCYKINVANIYGEITNSEEWKMKSYSEHPVKDLFCKDPKQWIRRRYNDSDFIIFVVSEGLYLSLLDDGDTYVVEMSHWYRALPDAKNYIAFQIFNSPSALKKKFCMVCFPYANKKQIPACLSDIGRCYQLPNEMKRFLGFLFEYKPLIPFTNLYPRLSRKDTCLRKVEMELLDKMKIVQEAAKNGKIVKRRKKSKVKFEQEDNLELSSGKSNLSSIEIDDHIFDDGNEFHSNQITDTLEEEAESCDDFDDAMHENKLIPLILEVFRGDNHCDVLYTDSHSTNF